MNAPLPKLFFPFDGESGPDMPAPGTAMPVADGVHWIRMPLPFQLDHINLWLIEDGDGWTLVDTGLKLEDTRDHWRTLFETMPIGRDRGRPAERLIVTHFHPDHIGLAAWLVETLDTRLWMSRTEWLMARTVFVDSASEANHANMVRFFVQHGLDPEVAAKLFRGGNTYQSHILEAPARYGRPQHGDRVAIGGRDWRVIVGTGHAPEHVCLYSADAGVLISGDQILPRITPNIGVWVSEPLADPLADYLGSMEHFRALPADTLVLPSHGFPFRGLHTRLDEIERHHEERLDALAEACAEAPLSAAESLPVLFRRELDTYQTGFAMGEALAHLACLAGRGRLVRRTDDDGIVRFHRP